VVKTDWEVKKKKSDERWVISDERLAPALITHNSRAWRTAFLSVKEYFSIFAADLQCDCKFAANDRQLL
jgi:hypothetical protein